MLKIVRKILFNYWQGLANFIKYISDSHIVHITVIMTFMQSFAYQKGY
jgi:hypothetical protein